MDFFLAFSPERVDPGNRRFNTRNVPKVVGGVTPDCTARRAGALRSGDRQVVPVSSPRVAEMVKLLENTFRAVNIGLVNELALMCDQLGIDVWEVIDAAATKPFGFMPFYPGPGLGGHCIPIDPFYLSWKARQNGFEPRFIELAGAHQLARCRTTSSTKIGDALNAAAQAAERLAHPRRSASPTSATSTTSGSRRRSTSWACSTRRARACRTAIRSCPKLDGRHWPGGTTSNRSRSRRRRPLVRLRGDSHGPPLVRLRRSSWSAKLVVDTRNAIKRQAPHVFRLGARQPSDAVLA